MFTTINLLPGYTIDLLPVKTTTRRKAASASKVPQRTSFACGYASAKPQQAQLGQQVGLCRATVHRIAQVDDELFPVKLVIHQTLTESQKTAHQRFCTWKKKGLSESASKTLTLSSKFGTVTGRTSSKAKLVQSKLLRFLSHGKPEV